MKAQSETNGAGPVEEEPAAKKRRWWRIALGWLKDESFYKDITTRAVAAGIVALGAYFFALGAGYVSTPTGGGSGERCRERRRLRRNRWVGGMGRLVPTR
jgi:hypothetical protein